MTDYVYSLFDKNRKVISPDLFSKAVYYSIWYGKTLKVNKEVLPQTSSRDNKEFLVEHVDYLNSKREEANAKRRKTLRVKKAKKLDKQTTVRKSDTFTIREKHLKLESKNPELNTFLNKSYTFRLNNPVFIDPKNSKQVDDAIEDLWTLYRATFPIVFREANKLAKKLKDHKNKFMVKPLFGHFDKGGKLIKDNFIKSYNLEDEQKAIEYASKHRNVDIMDKKTFNKKTGEYEQKLWIVQKKIESSEMEEYFDYSAISTIRFQAFDKDDGDPWFEALMNSFKAKAEQYLMRSYAYAGAIMGISIEYIEDFNL